MSLESVHQSSCCQSCGEHEKTSTKKKITLLIIGAVTFVAGMIITGVNFGGDHLFRHTLQQEASAIVAVVLLLTSYIILSGSILIKMVQNLSKGLIFDENFLMGIATLGAIAIDKLPEAVAVMLFYQIGEFFQELAVERSKKRIGTLMDIRPDYANLETDGTTSKVAPDAVKIGDFFLVKPGEKVPLDGVVIDGSAMLDTAALTGESVPRKVSIGETILSGCINQNGVLKVRATKTFGESTVSKILDLVENAADKKAPTETFITKFAKYYTPAVVCGAVLLAIIPPLFFGGIWAQWIHRALIFLIISCPCALVLSIPMGFFGGIGSASKKGILVKGGNYLEALSNLDTIVFDKTGTLTKGVFSVNEIVPSDDYSAEDLLEKTAYAEFFSTHPIAVSILKHYGKEVKKELITNYEEIAGKGIRATVNGEQILVGNNKLMANVQVTHPSADVMGTTVYVAVNSVFAGYVTISDEVRSDSFGLMTKLKNLGVRKTMMLTGDNPEIAKVVSSRLEIDEVHAGLLPAQKVEIIEKIKQLKSSKKSIAFVGDGINDAPVLAMSDVGIAMGGLGSDAAIEAADVVLMTDEPSKIVDAIKVARFTKRVVWQNIIMTLGVQFLFMYLATMGLSSLWQAVFADVGVSLLAVLNSMRILKR